MKTLFLYISLFCAFTVALCAKPKTKVVCFGDSITKRGYPSILATLLPVETVNAGIAGHNSRQGLRRMKKDVLDQKPEIVIIFFGTNDLRVDSIRAHVTLVDYEKNLTKIIANTRKVGALPIICTLPPIDSEAYHTRHEKAIYDASGGIQTLVKNYRDTVLKVAKVAKVPVIDLNVLLQKNPEWMHRDGVHPSPEGNTLIAEHIAKELRPLLKLKKTNTNANTAVVPNKILTAKWIPGEEGKKVTNPYTGETVDVRGLPSGTKVRDPKDSNKEHIFRVP